MLDLEIILVPESLVQAQKWSRSTWWSCPTLVAENAGCQSLELGIKKINSVRNLNKNAQDTIDKESKIITEKLRSFQTFQLPIIAMLAVEVTTAPPKRCIQAYRGVLVQMTVTCEKVLVAAWPTSHMGLLTSPWMVVRWSASLKMAALDIPKKRGRAAVAVHFFNDFTLKMSTIVGLQASLKKTNACFYVNGLFYLARTLKC